MIFSSI